MAKQTFTTGQVLTALQMTSLQATAMGGGAASTKTANYVLVAADAGTTVAMNAAGATTITVNTGLFAAGDTVFIQNIGAGVCTITAGTATVNTAGALALPQYDAGILYFTSASAAIFYDYIQVGAASPLTTKGDLYTFSTSDTRLGVGANGTVLTAASGEATGLQWAAPSAPTQDFALINSGGTALTGSGTTTINVSGKNQIFIRFNPAASAVGTFCVLHLRFNSDSGANYLHTIAKGTGAAGVTWGGFERATADSEIPLGRGGNDAADTISADVLISGANATGIKPIIFASYGLGTSAQSKVGTALYLGTSAITSVSIISQGQNFDAGTVFVYGA